MFERFTDRAHRVVVLAQEEARMLNHNYIGTEHLLLGLLREGEGIGSQILVANGLTMEDLRTAVVESLNGLYDKARQRAAEAASPPATEPEVGTDEVVDTQEIWQSGFTAGWLAHEKMLRDT